LTGSSAVSNDYGSSLCGCFARSVFASIVDDDDFFKLPQCSRCYAGDGCFFVECWNHCNAFSIHRPPPDPLLQE